MHGESDIDNEGKVEMCIDGIWMTTLASSWSYSNAQVVCRELRYNDTCKVNVIITK